MGYILYSLPFVLVIGTLLYLTNATWLPFADNAYRDVREATFALADSLLSCRGAQTHHAYDCLPTSLGGDHGAGGVSSPSSSSAGGGSFAADVRAGLTSANFDLAGNIESGDARAGLDMEATLEVHKIQHRRAVDFDEARRIYMERRLRANGIGADGIPRDKKLVTFS